MGKTGIKSKICISLPLAYPFFNRSFEAPFGGSETRISLIARELAQRDRFKISMVVGDFGQAHISVHDQITFYSWQGRELWGVSKRERKDPAPEHPTILQKGLYRARRYMEWVTTHGQERKALKGMIAGYPITPQMVSIYDEVNADIYLVPGNTIFSAEAAFFCKQRGKKYVFQAGSDFDYYPEYRHNPEKRDMYGTQFGLKAYAIELAYTHIVQNEHQAQLLKEGYGRSSVIIKNPIDLKPLFPRNPSPRTILWVGKSEERVKRPSLILELARQLPQYEFVVIMNEANPAIHRKYLNAAKELPNVTLLEYVPFERIESYFADARLHLNTSVFEGFPNTFLQAAKYGLPTISMQVDPGGMLSQHGAGLVCMDDFNKLKENVHLLMSDDEMCARIGRKAETYVREHHEKDMIIRKYEQVLVSVLSGCKPSETEL